jgi:hypothetical protein
VCCWVVMLGGGVALEGEVGEFLSLDVDGMDSGLGWIEHDAMELFRE